jgi:CBS domain-containing protein
MTDSIKHLRVRTRKVEGPRHQTIDRSVLCPLVSRSVAASSCRACDRCDAVRFDDPHGPYVSCKAARGPAPLPPLTGQHLPLDSVLALLLEHVKVGEVMSHDVVCAEESLDAHQLAELLVRHRFGGLPVVDAEGRPLGIVSKTDLLREAHETLGWSPPKGPVSELMTQSAFGLPEQASLAQAAALMAFEHIHRAPILSDDGKVVGIVTPMDIARWLAQRAGYAIPTHD